MEARPIRRWTWWRVTAPVVAVVEAIGRDDAAALTNHVLGMLQAWLAAPSLEESRLVVVTRGAVPAGGDAAEAEATVSVLDGRLVGRLDQVQLDALLAEAQR